MTTTEILLMLVTSLLSRVPLLIALLLGVVLLWRAPRVPPRRTSLAAVWLLFGCVLCEVAFQVIPVLLLQQGNARQIASVLGASRLVLTVVQSVGIGMLVWTLARSLQRLSPAASKRR
ncbi:hypothetical protein GGR61_001361 [Xanthomonas arboricola]|nr:hypothetical protein [Xanthomonas sp. 3058]